jgi:hypothetical protein
VVVIAWLLVIRWALRVLILFSAWGDRVAVAAAAVWAVAGMVMVVLLLPAAARGGIHRVLVPVVPVKFMCMLALMFMLAFMALMLVVFMAAAMLAFMAAVVRMAVAVRPQAPAAVLVVR